MVGATEFLQVIFQAVARARFYGSGTAEEVETEEEEEEEEEGG